jgi:hypothetical protein
MKQRQSTTLLTVLLRRLRARFTLVRLAISATTTLQFIARDTAGNTSTPVAATYTINIPDTTAPVLTITPAATFSDTQTVTMSATDANSYTIWYTVDGTDPTTSGTKVQYASPITLTATTTVKAYAVDSANNASAVQTVTYTKQAAAVTLVSDDFNRADASTLGTTPTGSKAWNGGLQIIGNQAGVATALTGSSGTTSAYEYLDAGVSDNIELSMDLVVSGAFSSNIVGLMFRFSDSNHHYAFGCRGSDQTIGIWAVGATGVSVPLNKTVNMQGTHSLKVRIQNSVITCYVDGVQQIQFTDSSPLTTNTKHGILLYNTTVPKVDNFVIKAI